MSDIGDDPNRIMKAAVIEGMILHLPKRDTGWVEIKPALFRIGPGYIEHWVHEVSDHWSLSGGQRIALTELEESFARLLRQRDSVQTARRTFLPASSLATNSYPAAASQKALFDSTHDFFLTYYSTLSALASFLGRFREELGNVPSRSNAKFIEWLRPFALMSADAIPTLQEARKFRALLDHKASYPVYDWSTINVEGLVRVVLHGPANGGGVIPEGALPKLGDDDYLPADHEWHFVAPDEDRVLCLLAVQLNAMLMKMQPSYFDEERARRCQWQPALHDGAPAGGYPVFAIGDGIVIDAGSPAEGPQSTGRVTPYSADEIDRVLKQYLSPEGPE